MSIQKNSNNSNTNDEENIGSIHTSIIVILLVLFVSFSAFALGRLSAEKNSSKGLVVETVPPNIFKEKGSNNGIEDEKASQGGSEEEVAEDRFLVGSKNSDKYHFPWCSGAKRINEENLISFSSYEEAKNAGYVAAQNCDGLE
ncbi:MAG: Ada metal-binding domain-containing protein [Candidatus Campbellbacteria bacterium]|nr:Ada metal-binding domain-containing protein [Candidatus Campbellbacteria bacterium]